MQLEMPDELTAILLQVIPSDKWCRTGPDPMMGSPSRSPLT